ncbi:serine hydrolase domain-containing protein [Parasphingopyxis lamellibrachiae]|uniref:CubicO group peptidase (Beta-lactamase class C family) n=1 Tax=Parasphingopyxis lamellibrachiae TaxID=680125 RepID=A0A3D9FCQ0_9SPHN|nr:serine hydrolase [Parasphingopyxis lamellibrachiae]RED15327.1 CubicO group peptidase (beta-lactamase class C family) [Parasphingopyxis lamellibrachiae]
MHCTGMTYRALLLLIAIFATASAGEAQQSEHSPHERGLAAGYKAAFLCSGIFNAGQTEAEATADDLTRIYPGYRPLIDDLPVEVDRGRRRVLVRFDDAMPPRVAQWRPHLGCVQLPTGADPEGETGLPYLGDDIEAPNLAATDALVWPQGDANAMRTLAGSSRAALQTVIGAALNRATYGAGTETTAVLVIRDGHIVGERYRSGYDLHRPQRTWSVAKSIAATVLGAAVEQDLVDLDEPAPVPAWQVPGDPRAAINWHNLLHMSSGLWSPFAGNRTDAIYFGGQAVTDSIPGLPLETAPGARWRYANNDTLIAMRALRSVLGDGDRALAFPFTDMLWRIGMTRTTPETDWQGNFIFSSQVWTTARDLGRLGLLYLNDGMWQGERILPEGWSAYVATPAPAQPTGRGGVGYGAQFWLFGPEQGLPAGTYAAMGNRGQYVVIMPERDIVIVRRGFDAVGDGERFDIARFSRNVLAAIAE